MPRIEPSCSDATSFCHVERTEGGRKRYFVVHAGAPRFVAEVEPASGISCRSRGAVIRRVCVPNSWVGDYHLSAKRLGDALEFFESVTRSRAVDQM